MRTNRYRELERALLIIEGLAMELSSDHLTNPGRATVGFKPKEYVKTLQQLASDCYCIAHAGSGRCCKGGNDEPFQKIADERAKFLKSAGIVDVDKVLKGKRKRKPARSSGLPASVQTAIN